MIRGHTPSIVVLASLLSAGCDFLDAATATTVVGGLIVSTPEISISGRLDVPAEVIATAWVGERQSATSVETPAPVGDAAVELSFGTTQVNLPVQNAAAGVYGQSSVSVSTLTYIDGAAYALVADINGSRFGGTVNAPPALTPAGLVLDPSPTATVPGFPDVGVHPANTGLTVSWGAQFGRYTYVTVLRADPNDPQNPQQVFDNRPQSTSEILAFVLGTPPTSQAIPADVFAEDGLYAVLLVAMNNANDLLPDTFAGSPILVGSGAAVLLEVGST